MVESSANVICQMNICVQRSKVTFLHLFYNTFLFHRDCPLIF